MIKSVEVHNVEDFKGFTWEQVREHVEEKAHILVMMEDESLYEIGATYRKFGIDAGAFVAVALLTAALSGPYLSIHIAYDIYEKISKRRKNVVERLEKLNSYLEYLRCYDNRSDGGKLAIDIPLSAQDDEHMAGMANVMFAMGGRDFAKGSTTEKIAAIGIAEFLRLSSDDS